MWPVIVIGLRIPCRFCKTDAAGSAVLSYIVQPFNIIYKSSDN